MRAGIYSGEKIHTERVKRRAKMDTRSWVITGLITVGVLALFSRVIFLSLEDLKTSRPLKKAWRGDEIVIERNVDFLDANTAEPTEFSIKHPKSCNCE